MTIPTIQINSTHVNSIGIFKVNVPEWLTSTPTHAVPNHPPATVIIGSPIIDMPGCVETHEFSDRNNSIIKDDEDNLLVFCDAEYPSYNAMDYEPDQLQLEMEATPPPVVEPPPAPDVNAPEVPPIDPPETECPAPNQPRVGDLTQDGSEKVIGHELQGTTCVVLYEDTTAVEKFLPSTNQVSTTAAIAVVATAGAAYTHLLLRVIKPVIKKLTTTVQKKLGKHRELSRNEIMTNKYREKKGLPPIKLTKKSIIDRYKK